MAPNGVLMSSRNRKISYDVKTRYSVLYKNALLNDIYVKIATTKM